MKTRRKARLRRLLPRYFETHRDRMQYPAYVEKGWSIGAGAIERAYKSPVKQRTDISGQQWSPDGALNILWARALITGGLFDACWQTPRDRESTVRETDAAAWRRGGKNRREGGSSWPTPQSRFSFFRLTVRPLCATVAATSGEREMNAGRREPCPAARPARPSPFLPRWTAQKETKERIRQ